MADETTGQGNGSSGGTPTRSPSFPFIDLETAIQRAEQFYEAERRNAAPSDIAVSHWGYSSKSSGGKQTLAALRAYGLLTGTGRVSLTPRALKIVVAGAPDRAKAIREAALAPAEFKKLWSEHGAEPPSDQSLRHELVINRGFNENAVDDFLKNYKNTIDYSGLLDSATMSAEGEDSGETPTTSGEPSMQTQAIGPKVASAPLSTEVPPVTFPLPRGNVVEIRLKKSVTTKEFQQLKQLFDLLGPSVIDDRSAGDAGEGNQS